jgi:Protein of unknown function (DUF1064)
MTRAAELYQEAMKARRAAEPRRHKYGARPARAGERFDGLAFASQEEARQYDLLRLRERAGEIVAGSIRTQVVFSIEINGVHVCDYIADFVCRETAAPDIDVVIDAKGVATAVYCLKKKLMKACHGVDIVEVGRPKRKGRR